MDNIPAPTQHNLLKSNLGNTQMLAQIVTFNMDSLQDEMQFIFTKVIIDNSENYKNSKYENSF